MIENIVSHNMVWIGVIIYHWVRDDRIASVMKTINTIGYHIVLDHATVSVSLDFDPSCLALSIVLPRTVTLYVMSPFPP